MEERYQKRVEKLQNYMQESRVDLALFTDRQNVMYFTGVNQIECAAVIIPARGEPIVIALWLDADYLRKNGYLQNVRGYVFPASNLGQEIVKVIRKFNIKNPRIGFGKYFVEFSVYEELKNGISDAQLVNFAEQVYRVRAIKDPCELEFLKKAAEIVVRGMDAAIKSVREGVKEVEVLAEAEYVMRKAGSEGSNFRMQVLTGERQLLAHPYAQNEDIKGNQAVVIHLGSTYGGYCAKMCRTVALGKIPQETKRIYKILVEAQQNAINALGPRIPVKEIYRKAYRVVEEAGYGNLFPDDIGHGAGLRQSEFYPILGRTREHIIEANMVVGLMFPTIYHGDFGGPRVTDIVHVTEDGPEILTGYTRDLIEI